MKRACGTIERLVAITAVLAACQFVCIAEPFGDGWENKWKVMLDEGPAPVRAADGSLEFDLQQGQHFRYSGGEQMHDQAVTARVKFRRADDKYSALDLWIRLRGEVFGQHSGYWLYMRPKYRSFHMQKVVSGKLDPEFEKGVKATRPDETLLNEWHTVRFEVRGREVRGYLNGKLLLSATDEGRFPIRSGAVAFGAGNGHVVVGDITQENLETEEQLTIDGYEYENRPTRGDEDSTVLTDGQVNPRADQAFWRMLGPRPEIIFDLGAERFITTASLKAISAPAVNIASAEILGSADKGEWETLALLENRDTRRAEGEHELAGPVRGIARYVKLVLYRPAADQDVELAEVSFRGRAPTEEDRASAGASAYVVGPEMPALSETGQEDGGYWYLAGETVRVAIDRKHGLVAGGWNLTKGARCVERMPDSYYMYRTDGDIEADEYADEIAEVISYEPGNRLQVRCRNPKLPDLVMEKTYSVSEDGRRVVKRVAFRSTSERKDRFLTHRTGCVLAQDFRQSGVYMGGDRGMGARVFADDVKVPLTNRALGSRNSKAVLFIRYDLGWGLAQYRYKVNDRYCRPVTSRWYEKENHPPVYMPNGWEVGLATIHLDPAEEQSTETHLAMFDGRQYDYWGMYRNLPEVKAGFDEVIRPAWVRDLKTSCEVALNPLSEDFTGPLLPVKRTLEMTETGILWDLQSPHGVWGEWFSEGKVTGGYGAINDTRWTKDYMAALHALSPRLKTGVYTWAWAVHPRSKVYREHPEWFITTDRNGQVFNAYSNMVLNHARRMGIPESMDELMDQFAAIMREYKGDYFYLDGGGGGQNLIDWEHLGCDQDYHYEELYRRIRQVSRACGDDRAVWFNARTGPSWDIGFYEGIDQRLNAATWRESADGFSAVKIRHAYDPDQVVIPLYWRTHTRPFYSNYCIGLGITPANPLGAPNQRLHLPFIEAAFETRDIRWVEADLKPDWRVDRETEIEAFALKSGETGILSVIDHRQESPGVAEVSCDAAALGLDPAKPIYARVFGVRDIRNAWPSLPEATRRQVNARDGWGIDLAMRLLDVEVLAAADGRVAVAIPTEQHLLRMVLLSNSPAGVFSVRGQRTNLWMAETLGAEVTAGVADDGASVSVESESAEPLETVVSAPPGKAFATGDGRQFLAHGIWHTVLPLEAGTNATRVALVAAPEVTEGLDMAGVPVEAATGDNLCAGLPGTVRGVSLWRDGALVAARSGEGAASLMVPKEAQAGTFTLTALAEVGGKMLAGEKKIEITSGFEPDLTSVYLPKRGPQIQVETVSAEAKGLTVFSRGTDSHDGYDGAQAAYASPGELTVGGGNVDAPRSRYGYGFGGLELEGPPVLTLKITNTFFDAWTYYRDRISYKPEYTSTYAGMMVDYHTAEGYTKRVALGLGVINPKRTAPAPTWGKKAAPDEFISLADAIGTGREMEATIDIGRWAPPDWDGRFWLSAGADNVFPSRRVTVQILAAEEDAQGRELLTGIPVGELYKLRTYRAGRAKSTPEIDGRLDDGTWQGAFFATDFRILGRLGVPTQATRAALVHDDENVYIAVDCSETGGKQLNTAAKKIWNQDAVDIALDVDYDRTDWHQIIVNCRGESEKFTQGSDGVKVNWDYRAAAAEYDGGWAVEIAVPVKHFALKPARGTKWTGNFVRYRPDPPGFEIHTWSPIAGASLGVPDRFSEIVFE